MGANLKAPFGNYHVQSLTLSLFPTYTHTNKDYNTFLTLYVRKLLVVIIIFFRGDKFMKMFKRTLINHNLRSVIGIIILTLQNPSKSQQTF